MAGHPVASAGASDRPLHLFSLQVYLLAGGLTPSLAHPFQGPMLSEPSLEQGESLGSEGLGFLPPSFSEEVGAWSGGSPTRQVQAFSSPVS